MSRTVTPNQGQQTTPQANPLKVPHDKIAMRAYEKWLKRGKQTGCPEQDWLEAEKELTQEFGKGQNQNQQRR